MFRQLVRPGDLGQGNSLSDLEARPSRLKSMFKSRVAATLTSAGKSSLPRKYTNALRAWGTDQTDRWE